MDLKTKSDVIRHLESLEKFGSIAKCFQIEDKEEGRFFIRFFTFKNRYTINVKLPNNDDSKGYMGCGASSRMQRAGEDWNRGSDLADGDLSSTTWAKILCDVISYEIVQLSTRKPSLIIKD